MTIVTEQAADTAASPTRRRFRLVAWLLVAALAIAGSGIGIGWLVYTHTYQPWSTADMGYWTGHGIVGITDGTRETALIDRTPIGQVGWFGMALRLGGTHDVRVLGGVRDDTGGLVSLKFQALPDNLASSPASGTAGPLTVHPREFLTIWIMIKRRSCAAHMSATVDTVAFRWEALGVTHLTTVPVGVFGSQQPLPIYVCYDKAALSNIYRP